MADDLVRLLLQATASGRIPPADAPRLLRPLEDAAAAHIAGRLDPNEASLHAIEHRYVPAIMEAVENGAPLPGLMDAIAKALNVGSVAADGESFLRFKAKPGASPVLVSFMDQLLQRVASAAVDREQRPSRTRVRAR